MNWIKNDWVNFRNLLLAIFVISLLLDVGISIVDGVVYVKFLLYGLGAIAFCVAMQWIFRNNK